MATANPGDLYKDIEKLSTCTLCLEIYCEPRHLPCMHAFCTRCLQTLLDSATAVHKSKIACPTCRLEVPVQAVTEYPVAFICNCLTDTLQSFQSLSGNENICHYCEEPFAEADARWVCTDCIETMCSRCRKHHSKAPTLASHTVKNKRDITDSEMEGMLANQTRLCAKHKKALEFLCETCKKLLCVSCALVDHTTCSKKEVTTVIDEHRKMLQESLDQRKLEIDESNIQIEKLNFVEHYFDNSVDQAKKHVADTAKQLKHEIEQIEEKLLCEIEGKASSVKKTFQEAREEETSIRDKATISVQYSEMSLRTGTPVDIIHGNLQSSDVNSKVTTTVKRKLKTLESTSMKFVRLENIDLQKAFGTLAVDSLKRNVELKYTTIFSKTLGMSYRGVSENDNGTFCLCHSSGLDIYSETGDLVKALISQNGLFDVCSAAGFTYVVTQGNKTLHVYKQGGGLVKSVPVAVFGNAGIAYSEGDLYVSNHGGNSINKLAGVNTSNVNTSIILKDVVSTPNYIAVNSDVIVVSCYKAHQIKVFNISSLQPLFTYGDILGSNECQLYYPWGVGIDVLGNILIADSTNKRIHVLDPNGKLLTHIKTTFNPSAIFVDSNLQLYICSMTGNIFCKVEYYFE